MGLNFVSADALLLCKLSKPTGIGLPEIALPVLLLPAVNCRCKVNCGLSLPAEGYRYMFACSKMPIRTFAGGSFTGV